MNKADLVSAVADKTGLSKKDSEKAVNAAFDVISDELVKGGKVQRDCSRCVESGR